MFVFSVSLSGFGQAVSMPQRKKDSLPVKFDSLSAAVVTATLRPRMRGDTLEYNVEHVRTSPNGIIEDLLRRLPGLRVDPDGTIYYNGEKIQHLLVDGEDIFENSPLLITRNFDADKIARIQILERKSDHATFTGMDDGTRVKTLNLVLKDEARNGYFGRIEASGNQQGNYNLAGALAGFKNREQLTALILSGNTGVLGFNSNSAAPASIGFLYSISDPLGASAGKGIPRFSAAALHYSNFWNGMVNHLVANYQYGQFWSNPVTTTSNLQTFADSTYSQRQASQSINRQDQHAIDGQYSWAPNRKTALQVGFHGYFYKYENQYSSSTLSAFNGNLANNSFRSINDQTIRHSVSIDASWRVQIGEQLGRYLTLSGGFSNIQYATTGYLYSTNHFFQADGSLKEVDTIDQLKRLQDRNFGLHGGLVYTQPIYPGAVLGISYDYSIINDDPLQRTYNRERGKYDEFVDSLSNDFKTQTVNHSERINIQGKYHHLSYTLGLDLMEYNNRQKSISDDSIFQMRYTGLTPKLLITFTPRSTVNLNFSYLSAIEQPLMAQLVPIKSNSDPLHLTIGNASLKPVRNQLFGIGFRWLKSWIIGAGLNFGFSSSSIGIKTITDSLGRQISQPINLDGKSSGGISISLNHTIAGVGWGLDAGQLFSQNRSYVNSSINLTSNYTSNFGISASRYVAGKYNLQCSFTFAYLYSQNSIHISAPVHYWTQTHSAIVTIYLLHNYEFGSGATYNWQQATNGLTGSASVFLWNAFVSRSFLESNRLVLKASLNNLLNQSSGITRNTSGNTTTETATNILGRYWMFSIIYHFDKKFNKK